MYKNWRVKNADKLRMYSNKAQKKQRKTDPNFHAAAKLRILLWYGVTCYFKGNVWTKGKLIDALGCGCLSSSRTSNQN